MNMVDRNWGFKPDGTIVFEGERTVLLKRRSHHEIEVEESP
jgi:hypothetical protein